MEDQFYVDGTNFLSFDVDEVTSSNLCGKMRYNIMNEL